VRVRDREQYERVENWREWLAERDMELECVRANMSRPAWLARQAAPVEKMNLLTGQYRPGRDKLPRARRFLPAAGLAAALVCVGLYAAWATVGPEILGTAEETELAGALSADLRAALAFSRGATGSR